MVKNLKDKMLEKFGRCAIVHSLECKELTGGRCFMCRVTREKWITNTEKDPKNYRRISIY
jgi:hypothetical protein